MAPYGSVLLTGASSGLGRAFALACAAPGALLHLSGRDPERLEQTASQCRSRGAEVLTTILDVRNALAMGAWIEGAGRLDLAIANAGISAGTGDHGAESSSQTRAIFDTNLSGMLNTVLPALAAMRTQEPRPDGVRGRIAVVASIAAFVPAPGAPAYCASKAAADAWTVGTAPSAWRDKIQLTSICPGYIRTPMTARNRFPMPGLMDADRAARIALDGIAAGRIRVVFPRRLEIMARLVGLLPPSLMLSLLGSQRAKAADAAL